MLKTSLALGGAIALAAALALVLGFALGALFCIVKAGRRVNYMVDLLEDGETTVRFRERGVYHRFNTSLNRLKAFFMREKEAVREREEYYAKMLDHIRTGVVVLDGENVAYRNSRALELLGLTNFNSLRQLANIDACLSGAFAAVQDGHHEVTDIYSESGKTTLRLYASRAFIRGREVKIITFDDISRDLQDNQDESWSRLIRVLTHEIMNTVTPIATLSQALAKDFDRAGELGLDIRAGLETIASSSESLIGFVEDYRALSRVAAPRRKSFMAAELADILKDLSKAMGVDFVYTEKQADILMYADKGQISQVLVNLAKNAVQAGATRLEMTAGLDSRENVVISVSNDGRPISKDASEQIFVPFYTTKKEGTGIGLSLSRQIMRLHNGSISLTRSDAERTTFTLIFR